MILLTIGDSVTRHRCRASVGNGRRRAEKVCTKPSPTCDFYGLLGRDNMQIIDLSEPNK